jgi:oligogalacturonide lyase
MKIHHPSRSLPVEWKKFPDARTGREVWQITEGTRPSEAVYFEAQGFTADERYLVFRSERTGSSELFRCDLSSGELVQLTEDAQLQGHSPSIHPDGHTLYFIAHDALWKIDVATGEIDCCFQHPQYRSGRLWPFPLSFSRDGRLVALAVRDDTTLTPIPGGIGQSEGPRMELLRLDLSSGEATPLFTCETGFSHPLICPGDPDLVTYVPHGNFCWNMDLPRSERVRTMIHDHRSGTARPFLCPLKHRTITHESWSPDGERFYFFDKNGGEWIPVSICSVNRQGKDWQTHFTSFRYRLGHGITSPDGRSFVSDCQEEDGSPLFLIDLKTGGHEILCWPDASNNGGHDACAHVHPSFSPRGNYLTYTSDRTGTPQVYVVPLNEPISQ